MNNLLMALWGALCAVDAVAEDPASAKLFFQRGIDGARVIAALASGQTFIDDACRANRCW